MAPVRLRHPKGVATIDVPFDAPYSVADLQHAVYAATQIVPSRQTLKAGYPPRALVLVPELPVSSLDLQRGDQLIVSESATPSGSSAPAASATSAAPAQSPSTQRAGPAVSTLPPLELARRPAAQPNPTSGPDHVELDGSFLIHRVVPDDNSCLFSSAALVFEQSISKAPQLRKIVADGIRNNPEKYNEAILGMPPTQYITTILKPTSWGGAIELSILAAHYSAEIDSVDVETGRIDHFSPGEFGSPSGMRAILIYSGIHYDAATLAPMADAPSEWHQTLFPITSTDDSDPVLIAAKKLADILRSKKAFTNTATFDLKCEVCGQGLKGEKGARAHAEETGHVRFGEY
ncbi:OTU-domain-containing protein [Pholiota conissans]|uniref:Ubiquitin thioesterase OTU n=1 Tax=Pholiota conissans TaxID=109636 RepID=A0A9P5YXN8_9AGAR|nr:OTU-domain-containing protein [Pholiota conissans]